MSYSQLFKIRSQSQQQRERKKQAKSERVWKLYMKLYIILYSVLMPHIFIFQSQINCSLRRPRCFARRRIWAPIFFWFFFSFEDSCSRWIFFKGNSSWWIEFWRVFPGFFWLDEKVLLQPAFCRRYGEKWKTEIDKERKTFHVEI